MLLSETYNARWLVHITSDVPDVEILSCVHHKELAKAVHETRRATHWALVPRLSAIIVDRAPVNLHDWQLARIAPYGDR